MNTELFSRVVVVTLLCSGICSAGCSSQALSASEPNTKDASPVDSLLTKLKETTNNLTSYQCRVRHTFRQPLLDSRTVRTGRLYYARYEDRSKLRIDFDTLQQDDEPQQQSAQHYIFDGQWITHIDYQVKHIQRRELAEPNESVDAFELASRNFPILGFSNVEDLQEQFDVTLVDSDQSADDSLAHLHLEVKPDSTYKDDYTSIDFWIDKTISLPARIAAITADRDIESALRDAYDIELTDAKIDEPIDPAVFTFEIPAGFGPPEIIPLKDNPTR